MQTSINKLNFLKQLIMLSIAQSERQLLITNIWNLWQYIPNKTFCKIISYQIHNLLGQYEGRSRSFEPSYLPLYFCYAECYRPYLLPHI